MVFSRCLSEEYLVCVLKSNEDKIKLYDSHHCQALAVAPLQAVCNHKLQLCSCRPDFSWVFGLLHHCQVFSLKLKDVLQQRDLSASANSLVVCEPGIAIWSQNTPHHLALIS